MRILRNRPPDNCDSIRPLLSAYLDGRVTDEERAAVEQHLVGCAGCRSELAQLRLVVSTLRALPPLPVPRSFALRREEVRVARAPVMGSIIYLRRA
ncbi:MAG: anti-sigma factor family protein, partial [Chloroflexota bacterium]